jgi:hypothetical protein
VCDVREELAVTAVLHSSSWAEKDLQTTNTKTSASISVTAWNCDEEVKACDEMAHLLLYIAVNVDQQDSYRSDANSVFLSVIL